MFGLHDPLKVKAFCYATTASDRSSHRQQIEREAPVFRDVSSWASDKLVEQIVEDGIHILVNLNGYFGALRMGVFAHRPALLQVNYLGFPGSLGADYMDYILADAEVIPPGEEQSYSEKVVRLPGSYQINDAKRALVQPPPRSELLVDGVPIEVTPPAPLPVTAGRHRVEARRSGKAIASLEVTAAGGLSQTVHLEVAAAAAPSRARISPERRRWCSSASRTARTCARRRW